MQHAKLSPSASHRWLVCPGSVAANEDRAQSTNKYALEGTSAHALLQMCLTVNATPEDWLGDTIDEGLMPVDEGMVTGVQCALDYIDAYCKTWPATKVYAEKRVVFGPQIGAPAEEAFGLVDVVLDNYPFELVALDYKHGVNINVSVRDNSQLMLYLLGLRNIYDLSLQTQFQTLRYRAVIVQPRAKGSTPVQEATFTDAAMVGWARSVVRPVVPIALGADAPRKAGDHCRYCEAHGNCDAQYKLVQTAATKEFKTPVGKASDLTPKQLAKLLDLYALIKPIADATKEHAIKLVHEGTEIPGYTASWGPKQRRWADDKEAHDKLAQLGLTELVQRTELISPAQAEKALKKLKLWPKKDEATGEFTNPLEGVITYTEPNPSIEKSEPNDLPPTKVSK